MLSRLPLPNTVHRGRNIAEEYVHYIPRNAVPKAMSLTQLQQATSQDPVLQQVHQSVVSGNWTKTKETHPYFCVKDELTATEPCFFEVLASSSPPVYNPPPYNWHMKVTKGLFARNSYCEKKSGGLGSTKTLNI